MRTDETTTTAARGETARSPRMTRVWAELRYRPLLALLGFSIIARVALTIFFSSATIYG